MKFAGSASFTRSRQAASAVHTKVIRCEAKLAARRVRDINVHNVESKSLQILQTVVAPLISRPPQPDVLPRAVLSLDSMGLAEVEYTPFQVTLPASVNPIIQALLHGLQVLRGYQTLQLAFPMYGFL